MDVSSTMAWLKVDQPSANFFTKLHLTMDPTSSSQGSPHSRMWLNRHLLNENQSLFYQSSTAQQIHHATIMLLFRDYVIHPCHFVEQHSAFLDKPVMATSAEQINECYGVR
ncbi:hypothetical protein IEQ34_021321 [Dendrobium chrysotoxum]|uniref:Uncharacterized protein n=1 Tax=Dendrobium chrysotoxum TaxID=161865 RepID=A0AAV7FM65_DENCH|nr:hypothetical protein IEQ34_021321 [Dendrobium chrysotoxum]